MKQLKILFFLFLLYISINTLHAQEIEWQNTIGGSGSDVLYSVEQTTDGGYILGGYSESNISGDKSENSQGFGDYWIVKLDVSGVIQWQNTIGGSSIDRLQTILQTTDGGYLAGGYSSSGISGDKTEDAIGSNDYWIIKLDSVGVIQWQNTIGGTYDDQLLTVSLTTDGGFLLGGWSQSNISGDKTENSFGGTQDYWVVKLDSFGTIQWQNTIGGNSADYLTTSVQTSDGGYIVGGYSISNISGDKTENSLGGFDYWVIKLDSVGVIQWQNTIGGSDIDQLFSISTTIDGGYLLGGSSQSDISGDKTEVSNGNQDYWVVKLDSLGVIQWQNTIGGNSMDNLNSVKQTNDGGYIIAGDSQSSMSGDKSEFSQGSFDYWIIKLDDLGFIKWQNIIGGNDGDFLFDMSITNDNGCIIGGYSRSNISGDKTEDSQGISDYWVIKLATQFNLIQGIEFIDLNNNNIIDSNEPVLPYESVSEMVSGRLSFTDDDGFYSLAVLDSGNFQVQPTSTLNYYNSVPLNHNVYFNSILQIDSLNDFAFQAFGSFTDLCVTITPITLFRSGFLASYLINYKNVGTTTVNNSSLVFLPDSNVSYSASSNIPSSVTPDSVVWNIGTLSPFQTGSILVTVNVNLGLPIGTLINSGARILPVSGDANPSCNTNYWEVVTTGSFDPNDILVNRDTLFTNEFPNPPFLDYIVRFQNTGNDTAFTVKILNPLDTIKLDLSSLEFVASSHPVDISFVYHERNMHFQFDNILLPDSNINEPESHGFVRYRIKPKSNLLLGDVIPNFAAIYFDFNDPVITNTVITEVVMSTGISEKGSSLFHVYPNPANDKITIHSSNWNGKNANIELYNIYGQRILTLFDGNINQQVWRKTFSISGLSSGLYFIKVSGHANSSLRFVKL